MQGIVISFKIWQLEARKNYSVVLIYLTEKHKHFYIYILKSFFFFWRDLRILSKWQQKPLVQSFGAIYWETVET